MSRLTDDMAFGLPGGTDLNARYSRDPEHPGYLSPDAQEIRYVGKPEHLQVMKDLGNSCRVIVVHGTTDTSCPVADAREMVANMQKAGFIVEPYFLVPESLDGKAFLSTGHSLGNRTLIVFKVAERYLLPDSPDAAVRKSPTDFERRDTKVVYPTSGGRFVISYEAGYPVGKFEPRTKPGKVDGRN
jgi:hypothetical protein